MYNDAAVRYLIRRILLTIPVLFGVATLVFALIHLVPGDPAQAIARTRRRTCVVVRRSGGRRCFCGRRHGDGIDRGVLRRQDRSIISRVMDVLLAFPGLLLAIALVAVLGPSLENVVLALTVIGWVGYARLVRGQVLRAREFEYVVAARALGAERNAHSPGTCCRRRCLQRRFRRRSARPRPSFRKRLSAFWDGGAATDTSWDDHQRRSIAPAGRAAF
jgi:hypothetical protein